MRSSMPSPEPLAVDRATECHVTPAPVAARMAEYLNLEPGLTVLEPECGTGNLIAAVLGECEEVSITAIERHHSLYEAVTKRFDSKAIAFQCECFLSFAGVTDLRFDRVIMNPPFRQTKKHVSAALKLLKPGGALIALVPITYQHEDAYEIEELERGIFPTANVSTKIIEIEL